ncbi:hypothetical protein C7476_101692 [Phyllobacterium bourgognense]|uniref:Uncharacterized protein n=1 Tax=Phyllobacterium bourgognense TaxID=314236 RepID=A0A368Z681_9HYPH|nr:hypothetical protein C7476_101692 [Phyllobacterium bourgognense]
MHTIPDVLAHGRAWNHRVDVEWLCCAAHIEVMTSVLLIQCISMSIRFYLKSLRSRGVA